MKTPPAKKTAPAPASARATATATSVSNLSAEHRMLLWLVFLANSLFFLPQCLDRYLAPRFLFLSLVLLAGFWLLRRDFRGRADWRLQGFDLLLLGWYGLNAASVGWAFSWSEGVFFSQKVLLLFLTYWLLRQSLFMDEARTRQIMAYSTVALTFIAGGLILGQLVYAFMRYGLENDALYDYASGVFGNKGLASDFLFFLLIFNVLFYGEIRRKAWFWLGCTLLLTLILLLQTRTVYLAVAGAGFVYFPLRAATEPDFRPVFFKKILPATVLGLGLLIALVALKGRGSSLSERLNPMTYLESVSANERRFVWYKTDVLNRDHYWWGVGNGSWKIWFPSKSIRGGYRLEEKSIVFTRAHNDYLEVQSEMGMVGAVFFVGLFLVAFGTALWALFVRPVEGSRAGVAALIAGLLGYCVIQYFDFPRERIEMQVVLAMFFAFMAHSARSIWAKWPGWQVSRWSGVFFTLVFIGLIFNAVIGIYRVSGEIHNVRLMQAMGANDARLVLKEARAAQNPFYEFNDTALPLQWFEGIAQVEMRRPDLAVPALAEAYRLNPWSFQVLNNYASALAMNRQYKEALPLYKEMLEINPRYAEGQLNLAYTYLQLRDTLNALEWANRLDTIPNPQNDDDRAKNRMVLDKKAELFKMIGQPGH